MSGADRHTRVRDRLRSVALDRPFATVFIVALTTRLLMVAVLARFTEGAVIPDEAQYLMLGDAASRGVVHLLWPGYGLSLYDSTVAFSGPLAFVFRVFGPELVVGRVFVAVLGAIAAVGTAALAHAIAGRRAAFRAGILAAILPSQVLWSSTLLRESLVWASLIAIALMLILALTTIRLRTLALVGVVLTASLWALAHTRDHIFLLATWSAVASTFLSRPARPLLVRTGVFVLALTIPLTAGLGVGGVGFAYEAAQRLGSTRTHLARAADSAIVENEPADDVVRAFEDALVTKGMPREEAKAAVTRAREVALATGGAVAENEPANDTTLEDAPANEGVPREESTTAATGAEQEAEKPQQGAGQEQASASAPSGGSSVSRTLSSPELSQAIARYLTDNELGNFDLVVAEDSGTIVVDNGLDATLRHMPRGLLATLGRPLPWEGTDGFGPLLARLENLFWYPLYALAALGGWAFRHRRELITFPALALLAIALVSALTQGNVGTAFRHRGQLLWALAVFAALGVEHLLRTRLKPAPHRTPVRDDALLTPSS